MIGLELLFSDHVRDLDTSECGSCRMKGLEAQSWTRDLLDKTVILFNDVIQIFNAQDFNPLAGSRELKTNINARQPRQICSTFVDHNS